MQVVTDPAKFAKHGAFQKLTDAERADAIPFDQCSEEIFDLCAHVDFLSRIVNEAINMPREVVDAFDRYQRLGREDNWYPKKHVAQAAIDAFHTAMPKARVAKLLNGWTPDPEFYSRQKLDEVLSGVTVPMPAISMSASGKEDLITACYQDVYADPHNKVELAILYGTSQAEAIEKLELMLQAVRLQWPSLMRRDFVEVHTDGTIAIDCDLPFLSSEPQISKRGGHSSAA